MGAKPTASLSDLPLVGPAIPTEAVRLTELYGAVANRELTAADAVRVNQVLAEMDPRGDGPRLPVPGMPTVYQFGAKVTVDGHPYVLFVPTGRKTSGTRDAPPEAPHDPQAPPLPRAADDPGSAGLSLSFGPVRLRGLALDHADGQLALLVDAQFVAGPVEFTLLGLGLGIRLGEDFAVEPRLRGAALFIDKPPLKVAGLLESRPTEEYPVRITGSLAVETGVVALAAMGSYARDRRGWASVFLFGEVGAQGGRALFGPPAFTVNSISGGFGVNSTVRTPDITEIPEFPLVRRITGGDQPDLTPEQMLEELTGTWVTPHEGRYWGAVGLEFTTFQFMTTRALALVEFGDAFKAMILGRTSLTFPKNASASRKVHARLNIDVKLAYESVRDLLSLDIAVGEGSFVFDPSIRLTGGISVYVWTGGTHGGDFVICAGGYHPNYTHRPAHYPPPPAPLGFVWSPDDRMRVSAQGYTALTPNAFMLGGRLEARYDRGLLSAWFTAYLDALIQWNPFRLELDLGIRIGVAFTIKVWFVKVRVSIEVGIDLSLWTPPLGGRVKVSVWFVSFSFSFGSARTTPPPLGWAEMRKQLPEPLAVTPLSGLLADVDTSELAARARAAKPTLVSAFGFALGIEAAMPASVIKINRHEVYTATRPVDVRPMKKYGITSEQKITITRNGKEFDWRSHGWTPEVNDTSVSRALWGPPTDEPTVNEGELLEHRSTGLRLAAPPPDRGPDIGPITQDALDVERLPDGRVPLRDATARGPIPREDAGAVRVLVDTIAQPTVRTARTSVFAALTDLGVAPDAGWDGPLHEWSEQAGRALTDPPLLSAAR
ncbi:DUF6603 domain-containing protein [Streptomyces noursei]|uniref:DUF6603 domain-containing protein n=1 Tax=Streptomyces noursei TaxID=1971 RepID=UPI00167C3874|nr:DUF6603 domain-containing protein [Streptomyces noursei]MCZ1020334.1 hypothetical protein [Streptomyces noursei]